MKVLIRQKLFSDFAENGVGTVVLHFRMICWILPKVPSILFLQEDVSKFFNLKFNPSPVQLYQKKL